MGSIMWGAALKGLGDAGASLGDSAMQMTARDEQDRREQQRQQRLDAQLASQMARSSAARGVIDFSEGAPGEKTMAAKLDMDLPKYRQWRAAEDSGDFGVYETDAPPVGKATEEEQKALPSRYIEPVQHKYLSDKRRMFAEISQMFMQGDVYDDSVRGRVALGQLGIMAEDRIEKSSERNAPVAEADAEPAIQTAPRVLPAQQPTTTSVGRGANVRLKETGTTPDGGKLFVVEHAGDRSK